MKVTSIFIAVIIALMLVAGCADSLRFAPSQPQKQTAELTYGIACRVDSAGCEADSAASNQLVEGTRAAAAYMGRPAEAVDADQFETVANQANVDAIQRPAITDISETVDSGLSLFAELAILFGVGASSVAGKKLTDWISKAREKNKALEEIVTGNELLRNLNKDSPLWDAFKSAQSQSQSAETAAIVAQIKNTPGVKAAAATKAAAVKQS